MNEFENVFLNSLCVNQATRWISEFWRPFDVPWIKVLRRLPRENLAAQRMHCRGQRMHSK